MHKAKADSGQIDYFPCRYGTSRNTFRGPRRRVIGDYVAFLGGTETFGRDAETPFPARLERSSGVACINFGCANAGIDAFVGDHTVLSASHNARLTVLQLTGAELLSNRYYSVHGRRNDRFLRPSNALRRLFPDVDFTEIHFTHHLLAVLCAQDAEVYAHVVEEMQSAWTARMRTLLAELGRPVDLLCLAVQGAVGVRPLASFVTCEMAKALTDNEVRLRFVFVDDHVSDLMPADRPFAWLPDDAAHQRIADQLGGLLVPRQ